MARALLTPGQRLVIGLAISGHGMAAIAERLGVHRCSVEHRFGRARNRLRARNNMELVARAIDLGLVSPPRRCDRIG